jgi:aspartyl-tRNA(Asn)/glutamyl-tRNA(Gln) amidotransferase subunit C
MAIQRDEVRRIAELARLEIGEEELDRVAAELSAVLDYAESLKRLDLAGCEPLSFAPSAAALRADEPDGRRLTAQQALAMAPEAEGGFFLVPPVIESQAP